MGDASTPNIIPNTVADATRHAQKASCVRVEDAKRAALRKPRQSALAVVSIHPITQGTVVHATLPAKEVNIAPKVVANARQTWSFAMVNASTPKPTLSIAVHATDGVFKASGARTVSALDNAAESCPTSAMAHVSTPTQTQNIAEAVVYRAPGKHPVKMADAYVHQVRLNAMAHASPKIWPNNGAIQHPPPRQNPHGNNQWMQALIRRQIPLLTTDLMM